MKESQQNQKLLNLRVLAVLPGLELFGNERDNIEVYIALREQGAKVLIGISKNHINSDVEKYLQKLDFETFNLPFGNQWSWMWLKQYPLSIFEKMNQLWNCSRILLQQIKTFQPTHIHLGSLMGYNYIAPALVFNQIPLIYRMGDAPPTDSSYNLKIWHFAMKRASKVIAVSEFISQQIIAQGVSQAKITKIYNVAPSRLFPSDIKSVKRDGLVYVGRLAENKGLCHLFQAFSKTQEQNLTIVGCSVYDANFRNQLEDWVKFNNLQERVHFLGQVDDPTIYYAKSLIHVAPSIVQEALGMVVLEAKKVGTPSIVFPSGGLPEMIRHGIDGYICRDKTPEALTEAIEWMLADRDRLSKMGEAARHDYETRFGRERFLQEWANSYLDN
ncbi:glycosyltransferase family 4 protein [Pseudanabaena sp. ABRG5-3]|uniref:glycosyltransferase family 4 protein n=1 Tax=Pseudanabaena sp. ABRG5-3 TaxID=685565 RepID=UPI000DC6E5D7|nr:glycosyltransferase family 4 protein [Pseudanabaena sp. ABRG5-3]BBC24673.1 glycosyl transferase group 1 [Pseudanabaena sp. ABRG5-3]